MLTMPALLVLWPSGKATNQATTTPTRTPTSIDDP